jgi:hypothetical protein
LNTLTAIVGSCLSAPDEGPKLKSDDDICYAFLSQRREYARMNVLKYPELN